MDCLETLAGLYRELADCYDRRGEASLRDRFLVLAMDAALRAGRALVAEQLRHRLLQLNPHHMLRPFHSFAEAVQAADVLTYLRELRSSYPSNAAEDLLRSLRANTNGSPVEPPKVVPTQQPPPTATNGHQSAPMAKLTEPEHAQPVLQQMAERNQPSPAQWTSARPHDEASMPQGGWFGIILFVLVLVSAIALVGYTLLRPFVPLLVNAVKK